MENKEMPDWAYFQLNKGWGSLEQTIGSGTKYHADHIVQRLESEKAELVEALEDCYQGYCYIRDFKSFEEKSGIGYERCIKLAQLLLQKHK